MRVLIVRLIAFIRLYPAMYWVVLSVFCALSVYVNYSFHLNRMMDALEPVPEFLAHVVLYAVHTLFAYGLYSITCRNFSVWKQQGFWFLLLAGFLIFAFRACLWQHRSLIESLSPPERASLNRYIFNDLFRILYVLLPVFIIWWHTDRNRMPLYGFSAEQHKSGMYLVLLLCMVPLIAGASFLSDFLDYYPRFRKLLPHGATWSDILQYELFYGMDFMSIELFFRGFMVIAFIRYAGIHAVLPMAVFYMSIHYGKPMGEAISSFFGGSILGLIAYYSRSIYGGIMVHVGIAWLMELGAFAGNLIKGTM